MSIQRTRFVPVLLALVVLAATVALKLVPGSHAAVAAHDVSSVMNGFVNEDDSIGLSFSDGTPVGNQNKVPPVIPPGTYTVNVNDAADIHNFHLFGPGVDQATDVGGISTPTWTVTFQPGSTYKFQCDVHSDFMWGAFTTSGTAPATTGSGTGTGSGTSSAGGSTSGSSGSSAGSSTSSSGGSSSAGSKNAILGTIIGTVSSTGKVTLTWGGLPVQRVPAGRFTFTIGDKSKMHSFLLQESGHAARTIGSASKRSVTLALGAGKWFVYASKSKTKSTFRVR